MGFSVTINFGKNLSLNSSEPSYLSVDCGLLV